MHSRAVRMAVAQAEQDAKDGRIRLVNEDAMPGLFPDGTPKG